MRKFLISALCLLLTVGATAQQRKDANGVNDTTVDKYKKSDDVGNKYARPVPGSSRKGKNPVLLLIGDSTMRTGTKGNGSNGQWGWGAFAYQWFDTTRITANHLFSNSQVAILIQGSLTNSSFSNLTRRFQWLQSTTSTPNLIHNVKMPTESN